MARAVPEVTDLPNPVQQLRTRQARASSDEDPIRRRDRQDIRESRQRCTRQLTNRNSSTPLNWLLNRQYDRDPSGSWTDGDDHRVQVSTPDDHQGPVRERRLHHRQVSNRRTADLLAVRSHMLLGGRQRPRLSNSSNIKSSEPIYDRIRVQVDYMHGNLGA